MDITLLVKITTRAWALPILALVHQGVPGRQSALLSACGAGRTAFLQSLAHLVDLKLVEKNPGHGHPLRPEYRLTPQGKVIAALADKIISVAPRPQILLRRTWTLPIIAIIGRPHYFSDVKKGLPSITDRALSQSLVQLEEQKWVRRNSDVNMRPIRPLYQAINDGATINQIIKTAL